MGFAELFRALMAQRGISQAMLAKASNDHDSNLNTILQDKRPPPLRRVHAWADAMKLSGIARRGFIMAAVMRNLPEELVHVFNEIEQGLPVATDYLAREPERLIQLTHDASLLRPLEAVTAERDHLREQLAALRAILAGDQGLGRHTAEGYSAGPPQLKDISAETARSARESAAVDAEAISATLQHAAQTNEPQRPRRPARRAPARS